MLDGVLIGASDARFLARGMVLSAGATIPIVLLSLRYDWDLRGIWAGLSLFIILRAVTNGVRFRSGRWLRGGGRVGVVPSEAPEARG